MHLPRRRRPDFDDSRIYEYPQHLREVMDHLPQAPGVYAVALNESLGIPGVQALIEHLRVGAGRSRSLRSSVRS